MDLIAATASLRSRADRAQGLRDAAVGRLKATQKEIRRLANDEEMLGLVADLFRTLVDQEITNGVRAVEKLQTEGLQAVFPDMDLSVRADIEILRGKVSVDLLTVEKKTGGVVIEGMATDGFGGSVLALQSFLLRLTVAIKRGLRLVFFLDETLPAFDGNYISSLGEFLAALCARLNLDILLITHNPALVEASHRAYRIVRQDGIAHFEVIR